MTRFLALALLLVASSVRAQYDLTRPEFLAGLAAGAPFDPLNFGNPVANWPGDNSIFFGTTNGIRTLTDRGPNHYDLTNAFPGGGQPTALTNSLNGHTTVSFDGVNDFLWSVPYTNQQPAEWWLVMKSTQPQAQCSFISGGNASFKPRLQSISSGPYVFYQYAGTNVLGPDSIAASSNRWLIFTVVWDGGNSSVLTNNVLYFSGSAGLMTCSQLLVGSDAGPSLSARFELAELATFNGTNTPASRTALYNGFKNKYGL